MVNSQARLASNTVLQEQYLFIMVKSIFLFFFIVVAFCREDFAERRQHHSSYEYTVKLMIAGSINILYCPKTFVTPFGVCVEFFGLYVRYSLF